MDNLLLRFTSDQELQKVLTSKNFTHGSTEHGVFFIKFRGNLLLFAREVSGKLFVESIFSLDKTQTFGKSVLYDSYEDALADVLAMIGSLLIEIDNLSSYLHSKGLSAISDNIANPDKYKTSSGMTKCTISCNDPTIAIVCYPTGIFKVSIGLDGYKFTFLPETDKENDQLISIPESCKSITSILNSKFEVEICLTNRCASVSYGATFIESNKFINH